MARGALYFEVKNSSGDPVPSASINVKKRSDNTNATLYAAKTGGSPITNPLTADSLGRAQCWADRGQYNGLITGTGITAYTIPVEATPTGDNEIDLAWLPASSSPTVLTNTGASTTPVSPASGDRFIWIPVALDYITPCEFRYNASSISPYKWECTGGHGYQVDMTNSTKSVASSTQSSLHAGWTFAADQPTFTAPFTGEYDFFVDASLACPAAATYFNVGLSVNGATMNNQPDSETKNGANYYACIAHQNRVTCNAGDVLDARFSYVIGGGPFTILRQHASLHVVPARVL